MNMTVKQKDEIIDILENLPYWDTCPQDYKDRIPELVKALNQVNNGVLDDVINLFPSYDEALEEAQKTYLSKHVSEGVELYEEKAFMKGCNFIAQKVIGNNL